MAKNFFTLLIITMYINDLTNNNFKALNYSKVAKKDIGYVKDELPKLLELAKDYDIVLKSDKICLGNSRNLYDVIRATVSVAKDKNGFWERMFSPIASMNFYTNKSPYSEAEGEYLCDIIKKAIEYIN